MRVSILHKELKTLISGVLHAVDVDSYSPALQNCLIEVTDNTLSIIVIANAQMAKRSIGICNHPNENAIVNNTTLITLYKCLNDNNEYVVIESDIGLNTVTFKFDKFNIVSDLGVKFINYKNFYPKEHETHGVIKQPGLLYKALKPAKGKQHIKPMPLMIEKIGDILYFLLLRNEDTKDIVLKFDVPIHTYCRKDITVNLNINKLLDILEVLKNAETIELKFHGENTGVSFLDEKSNYLMWLLPIRV
jgi:DNA polymerase III sliding clamp (beta) subunit (PCNA family)